MDFVSFGQDVDLHSLLEHFNHEIFFCFTIIFFHINRDGIARNIDTVVDFKQVGPSVVWEKDEIYILLLGDLNLIVRLLERQVLFLEDNLLELGLGINFSWVRRFLFWSVLYLLRIFLVSGTRVSSICRISHIDIPWSLLLFHI